MSPSNASPPPPPRALLERPGLHPHTRLLIGVQAAILPGDWQGLRPWLDLAREHGLPRADVEEALLQAILFAGFPRVVHAFDVLTERWPAPTPPRGGEVPSGQRREAGLQLFRRIYAGNADAVLVKLGEGHEELRDFVLEAAYGRILARPGLDAARRELLAVGMLALLRQPPQLVAHGRGAMRVGASAEEVAEALWTVLQDDEEVAATMRRIGGRRDGG